MSILIIDDHNPEQGLWPPSLHIVDWGEFSKASNFEEPKATDLLLGIQGGPDFSWAENGNWEWVEANPLAPHRTAWEDSSHVHWQNQQLQKGQRPLTEAYIKEYFYPEKVDEEELAYYCTIEMVAKQLKEHFKAEHVGFTGVYW